MAKKKIILAYSGGLDTSVAVTWLKQKGFNVIAFCADLGQMKNSAQLEKKAIKSGASKVIIKDLREEFIKEYAFESLKASAIYENGYYMATALSRPLIAKHMVGIAEKQKAQFVGHGCTGKGNDQVRFEVSVAALNSKLKTIAPVREWELKTRKAEIDFAKKHKIPVEASKKSPYSIDKNLWGVSVECGILEDPKKQPPKGAYQITIDPEDSPKRAVYLTISFKKGIPTAVNGKALSVIKLVEHLNKIGGKHGIGRSDLVENRLVGIKSREIYEAPAAAILHAAHKDLESLTLDRETLHFKDIISLKFSEIVYYGLWFTPLKEALSAFIDKTQRRVTGTIKLKLYKGQCSAVSRNSKFSLYSKALATYEEGDTFNQEFAKGFIELWGLPYKKL